MPPSDRAASSGRPRFGRGFHTLFGASLIAALGTGMHAAALPLLVVQLTDDPVQLGLVVLFAELPWALVALHAGALVDRLDRRRVMVWADAGRCLALVVLVGLVLTGQATVPRLAVVAFALGVGQVFFDVAAQAAVPDLVPRDQRHLSVANARIAVAQSNGEDLAGPPLGSVLFGVWTVLPFAGNALTFAASSALIASIPAGPAARERRPDRGPRLWAEIAEGVRWMRGSRVLLALAVTAGLGNVVLSAQFAMLVLLATEELGLAEAGYGLLLAAAAVGGIAGSLLVTPATRRWGPGSVLLGAKVVEGVAVLVLGSAGNVLVAAAMMAVGGGLMTAQKVVTATLRQQIVPRRVFGRVLSASRVVAMAGGPVGAGLGGVLAAATTVRTPYLAGGAFLVLVALLSCPVLSNRALERAARSAEDGK
ncbi:MAG TPA: MFS transporter [Pseudonocardia sp.]|nr:MFS transporter [Pseudonocardia sp.]